MIEELFESLEDYENAKKLEQAQSYLKQTDYIANKIVEYQVLGKELDQDYTETLLKREEAREIIRNLENK